MKRLHSIAAAIVVSILILAGCDSASTSEPDQLMVVEAFLFSGEPVTAIRITEAIPLAQLTEDDSTEIPVNDAFVRLRREEDLYLLEHLNEQGYYHYPGTDLQIRVGDHFRLEVERGSSLITAETVVPPLPRSVLASSSELEVTLLNNQGGGGFGGGPPGGGGGRQLQDAALTLSWDNQEEELHFVIVESLVTGEPIYILPEFIRERFEGFRLVTEPTSLNVYDVNLRQLEVLGPHRAIVYRVNEEYGALYENREQDSRDLNEPPSNIRGGLGVFSAFSGVAVPFSVVEAVD